MKTTPEQIAQVIKDLRPHPAWSSMAEDTHGNFACDRFGMHLAALFEINGEENFDREKFLSLCS